MTCSVCGAPTSGGSGLCGSCDLIVGRGRQVGHERNPYVARPRTVQSADIGIGLSTAWFIAVFAAAVASGYLVYGKHVDPNSVGEMVGHVLGGALVALLVTGLLCWLAKTRFRRTFLIAWTIIVPLAHASLMLENQQQREQGVRQALVNLNQVLAKNPASGTSAPATSAPISSNGAGVSALQIAIEHITQDSAAFKQEEALRLQSQRNLHLDMALMPQRLISAAGIAQSRLSLEQYRTMLVGHQAALKAFEDRSQAYLAEIPQPMRSTVLAGFLQSRSSGDAAFAHFFDVENHYLDTAEQVLDIVQHAVGRSYLDRNGRLMLPEPMHTQIQGLARTLRDEVIDEAAAKQEIQRLTAEHAQAMNALLQQAATASPR